MLKTGAGAVQSTAVVTKYKIISISSRQANAAEADKHEREFKNIFVLRPRWRTTDLRVT